VTSDCRIVKFVKKRAFHLNRFSLKKITNNLIFFQDRLVFDEERNWTEENINMVAMKHFPNVDAAHALKRWLLLT